MFYLLFYFIRRLVKKRLISRISFFCRPRETRWSITKANEENKMCLQTASISRTLSLAHSVKERRLHLYEYLKWKERNVRPHTFLTKNLFRYNSCFLILKVCRLSKSEWVNGCGYKSHLSLIHSLTPSLTHPQPHPHPLLHIVTSMRNICQDIEDKIIKQLTSFLFHD